MGNTGPKCREIPSNHRVTFRLSPEAIRFAPRTLRAPSRPTLPTVVASLGARGTSSLSIIA